MIRTIVHRLALLTTLLLGSLHAHNPTVVFAHGLGGNQYNVRYYQVLQGNVQQAFHSFNFPHVLIGTDNTVIVDQSKVSLAQNIEINTLAAECKKVVGDKILLGVSMGASAIITYMATHQPTDIKALILESPFDTVDSVILHKAGFLKWLPGIAMLGNSVVSHIYPAYDPKGIAPFKVIDRINNDIPILLIHSKVDELIPYQSSRNLYTILRNQGRNNVHLLELNYGEHGRYIMRDDAKTYQLVVHAFYRQYGLPHNEALAQEGEDLFKQCQPCVKKLNEKKHKESVA